MNINRFAARSIRIAALIAGIWGTAGFAYMVQAQSGPAWAPQWTAAEELILPSGYREWVFLGAPLTLNALRENGRSTAA